MDSNPEPFLKLIVLVASFPSILLFIPYQLPADSYKVNLSINFHKSTITFRLSVIKMKPHNNQTKTT